MAKANRTKQLLQDGTVVLGTMVRSFRTPEIVPLSSMAGWDYLILDSEHTAFNPETVAAICFAASYEPVTVLIRVPDSAYHLLAQPLDFGAEGLIVPHVETAEQARFIVQSTKYFPLGNRGASNASVASRFPGLSGVEYMEWANRETLLVIQIETAQGLENVEAIVAVPGIDAVMIGPFDLSQSLGLPGEVQHPKMQAAFRRVVQACNRHQVAPGIHLQTDADVRRWIREGMRFVTYQYDGRLFREHSKETVEALRPENEPNQ